MVAILIALIINVIIIFVASYIVPGVKLFSFLTAVILALVLGIANAFVHHFLYVSGLPTNFWAYGLVSIVLNGVLIWFLSTVLSGLEVDGFKWAFIFAFVISVFNALIHTIIHTF